MKKIFTIIAIIAASFTATAQKTEAVKGDYSKYFKIDSFWIDYNQNGDPDDGEIYRTNEKTEVSLTFRYKDYGSAGNTMRIELVLKNKETGNRSILRGSISDILFLKIEKGFAVYNKQFGESLIAVMTDEEGTTAFIFNPAIFE